MSELALECRGLGREFRDGDIAVTVLEDVDLRLEAGASIAVMGASGSGKTTLMHLLGGLDTPTSGEVLIGGRPMHTLGEAARGRLRNRSLGFVYQFHHLLAEFTALENVAMPLLIGSVPVAEARRRAGEMLARVGLEARSGHKPPEMSGGERQRAAIARALVTRPDAVLADEPTGNLDRGNAAKVADLLMELNRDLGTSLLVVTHDQDVAARMGRRLHIRDGRLVPAPPA